MVTADRPTTPRSSRLRYLPVGVAASLAHLLMMIPGYNEEGEFETGTWLGVLAVSVLVSVVVFMFVVPGGGAVTAVALGAAALASVGIFWAGLTLPLAAAAFLVGWDARRRGDHPGLATAALALAVFSAVAVVAIIVGDAV